MNNPELKTTQMFAFILIWAVSHSRSDFSLMLDYLQPHTENEMNRSKSTEDLDIKATKQGHNGMTGENDGRQKVRRRSDEEKR